MIQISPTQLAELDQPSLAALSARILQALKDRPECHAVMSEPRSIEVVSDLVASAYSDGFRTQHDLARYVYLSAILRRDVGRMTSIGSLRRDAGASPTEALDQLQGALLEARE